MKKTINVEFNYGDYVTLKTEPGLVRQVTSYTIRKGLVTYGLACGTEESWHQGFELERFIEKKKKPGF